jgi:hypothetical protein
MVAATIGGIEVTYSLGAPGRHLVQNSLAVLAAVAELGSDLVQGFLLHRPCHPDAFPCGRPQERQVG